jgi:hypothetical protein
MARPPVAQRIARAARRTTIGATVLATTMVILPLGSGVGAGQPPPTSPAPVAESPQPTVLVARDEADVLAYVPVRRFWSADDGISLDELRAAIAGRSERFRRVVIAAPDPGPLWRSLGVEPGSSTIVVQAVHDVRLALTHSRRTIGLIPASEVEPDLRALAVDGRSLFGTRHLTDLSEWPLLMPAAIAGTGPEAAQAPAFDPRATWTMVAGGDVMLDREPYRQAVLRGRGPDWTWDGGFARVVSRTCCTVDGGPAITTRPTGRRGAVRALLSSADLAVVNHEAPAPNVSRYHPDGLVFTVDKALLSGIARAGIDMVSLANNHIRNAGSAGVMQTVRNLRKAGIRSFGAGGDTDLARRAACAEVRGQRVCLLGYDAINTVAHAATEARPGAAELVMAHVRADIRALRRDDADVIVVWPHWGTEYVTSVTARQRRQARAMIRAGADVVLGNHSHVTGPIEFVGRAPVLYSMGDLVFDLPRFEATEEGVLVELTFAGDRLAQVTLHPTVVVDRAQLALLDPTADGRVVLERMRDASRAVGQ